MHSGLNRGRSGKTVKDTERERGGGGEGEGKSAKRDRAVLIEF